MLILQRLNRNVGNMLSSLSIPIYLLLRNQFFKNMISVGYTLFLLKQSYFSVISLFHLCLKYLSKKVYIVQAHENKYFTED